MSNIVQRMKRVNVRVGGNSQETALMVDTLPNGKVLEKNLTDTINPTQTPPLTYTRDLLYMMRNISEYLDVYWFIGTCSPA